MTTPVLNIIMVYMFEPLNLDDEVKKMNKKKYIELLNEQFAKSKKLLVAIGNETRQNIIAALINVKFEGMRVGEITKKTHLSRPAVSHHLKVLLDADIIGVNRKGTKNFYYLKMGCQWQDFLSLINTIEQLRHWVDETDE